MHALGSIGGPLAVNALAQLMLKTDTLGRVLISRALGQVASPDVVGPLLAAVADESPSVRVAAREALRELPCSALAEGLGHALTLPDQTVRREAARLAPYYANEEICELLDGLAKQESDPDFAAAARMSNEVLGRKRAGTT